MMGFAGPEEWGTAGLTLTFLYVYAILAPCLHRSNAGGSRAEGAFRAPSFVAGAGTFDSANLCRLFFDKV